MTDAWIRTDRLVLRPPETTDADRIATLVGDWDVARWLTHVPHPYDLSDARTFIAGPGQKGVYMIVAEDGLVGCVSHRAELGYWLGRAFWGRGYASEAARALVARHFERCDDNVASGYHLGNARSAAVLSKLGFEDAHVDPAVPTARGDTVAIQRVRLTRAAWRSRT